MKIQGVFHHVLFDNACDAFEQHTRDVRRGADGKPDVLKFRITHPRPFINHIVDTQVKRDIVISKLPRCRIQILSVPDLFVYMPDVLHFRHGVHLFQNTVIQQVSKIFSRSRDLRLCISASSKGQACNFITVCASMNI
jgi:hypothetical protein